MDKQKKTVSLELDAKALKALKRGMKSSKQCAAALITAADAAK